MWAGHRTPRHFPLFPFLSCGLDSPLLSLSVRLRTQGTRLGEGDWEHLFSKSIKNSLECPLAHTGPRGSFSSPSAPSFLPLSTQSHPLSIASRSSRVSTPSSLSILSPYFLIAQLSISRSHLRWMSFPGSLTQNLERAALTRAPSATTS